jgi:hypothetical protein
MSMSLLTGGVWSQLTAAAKKCKHRARVVVAYFSAGSTRRLPLQKGSRLVVNAGDRAIRSGQTCPADLLRLVNRGVEVYSIANLHAKVYVFGRTAFVGSANASSSSESNLIEAILRTTDTHAVNAARAFVESLCRNQLTPALLKKLGHKYRPPKGAPKTPKIRAPSRPPELPRLYVANLHREAWPDDVQTEHDRGLVEARAKRKHPRSYELDSYRHTGVCGIKSGTKIMAITDEGKRRVLVDAPGNVLSVRRYESKRGTSTFIYYERPAKRRRRLKVLAKAVGRGALRRLRRGGPVNRQWADGIMKAWA